MQDNLKTQMVLGGNGAIGKAVVDELKNRNISVKALTLRGTVENTDTVNVDILDIDKFIEVTKDISHIYLCVGLPYQTKVWERDWPIVMKNTIEVCNKNNIKLIFFDNPYMYGPPPLSIYFDENTTQKPISRKGVVRKQIADQLMSAIHNNEVNALIGRSANFYGPNSINSILYISFLERLLQGKNPQLVFPINIKHTFSYTRDIARALVNLANEPSAYGEVWHLPVGEPISVEEINLIFNKNLNTNFEISVLPQPLIAILKLFITSLREVSETLYQFRTPFIMSDAKFMSKFPDFETTSYEEGLSEMINSFKNKI